MTVTVQTRRLTEAEVLVMLRERHEAKSGNGAAWAFATHVRSAAGFDATRTADAIAMSLWPSRGLELHGFEVKVSRSDWQRELEKPDKAEVFAQLVDRWWIVAGDEKIIHDGELPPTWGLLVVRGRKLVCKTEAPRLRPVTAKTMPPAFGRSFLAALLRASNKASLSNEELAEAREAARAEEKRANEGRVGRLEADVKRLSGAIAEFERAAGVPINGWYGRRDPGDVGRALRLILDGSDHAQRLEERVRSIVTTASQIAIDAERIIEGPQVTA